MFSSYEGDAKKVNDNQNKIELLNCQLESQKCKEHLLVINKSYSNACNFHLEKDYFNSIEALKSAYNKASELQETPCSKCAVLFRSIITQSLENMNEELNKMTSGIFSEKRYKSIYNESCIVLNDFKNKD